MQWVQLIKVKYSERLNTEGPKSKLRQIPNAREFGIRSFFGHLNQMQINQTSLDGFIYEFFLNI